MTKVVLLDATSHRQMSVNMDFRPQTQDGLGSIVLFPSELDAAHKEFPVFIRKQTDTGQFFLCALLSLNATQNQFLIEREWQTNYVPLMARRGPFLMTKDAGDQTVNMCIDIEDTRVSEKGERLFDAQGKPTEVTKHSARVLNLIHEGYEATQQLLTALSTHRLIEAIRINIPQITNEGGMLDGLFSVNVDKLKQLSGEALNTLNASGHLQMAYFVASSTANLIPLMAAKHG